MLIKVIRRSERISECRACRYFELSNLPPTTNRLFFNEAGKGRTKTAKYRSWRLSAGWELKLQGVKPLPGPVAISIRLPDGTGRAPDLDNTAKALIDLVTIHGIIDSDDKNTLRALSLRWDKEAANTTVLIEGVRDGVKSTACE